MLDFPQPYLLHIASIVGVLLALMLISQVLRSPRTPATAIGWLIIIIFVPIIGIPLYLTFGVRKLDAKINRKTKLILTGSPNLCKHPIHSLLVSLGIPSASSANQINFHKNGHVAYQALLALLKNAQHTIDIAIFVLGDDQIGQDVLSCLAEKSAQGVKIRLLLDGVGSLMLPKKRLNRFINNGGQAAWFIPVLHRPLRGRTNLRNHRKIVIADNHYVWTGGRNLANEYLDPDSTENGWIDLSFCLHGPAVSIYQQIFAADWRFATNAHEDGKPALPTTENGRSQVQVIPSGPDIADDAIYVTILTACYEAVERILIVTPYYIPDTGVQEALRLAALRGVAVDLILPAKSNHRLADIARNRYLRELDQVGIRIWFFPNRMVHAKALVVDNNFSMAGSANLDIRSLFLNYEVMNGFYSEKDIEWLATWLKSLRDQSLRYSPEPAGKFREMFEGLVQLAAYEL